MPTYLDGDGQAQKTYLDDSGNPVPPVDPKVQALKGAVSYAAQQDPVKYAKLLDLQRRTGISPVVAKGNEQQLEQVADANSLDPHALTAAAPQTAAWASNPDNAAVSGVDEIHRLAAIEQNAVGMRAYTPTLWDKVADRVSQAYTAVTGQTPAQTKARLYEFPLTRGAIDAVGGAAGMAGNVGSFFGWHGDGPSKQNLLQRLDTALSPEVNTDPAAAFHQSNEFDWLAKNVAPMIPAMMATGGTSLIAKTLGLSETAAKVMAGLTVGGAFTADQAGRTYTQMAGAGRNEYDARLAANRVGAINALPNALFGATDVVPFMRDNPLLTSLGLGGLTGTSGQVSQNVVTGKPTFEGVLSAAIQGAAVQGGMHLGTDAFFGNLAQAVSAAEDSKLRERSPEKFHEAMQTIFHGDESLRIPADKFNEYFQGKGMNPQAVASDIGATNYPEAVVSGGEVEVPKADFLGKLDPEHQQGLLQDVVDPSTGLTARQHQEGREELQQWVANGGPEKLQEETAKADAETAASPEWQTVKEDLRQRYVDAGETPEVADTLATKDAHVYANLAKSEGLKPTELLNFYNPKVVSGDAPGFSAPESPLADVPLPAPTGDLQPGQAGVMRLSDLNVDPKRFQYKLNTDSASGAGTKLADAKWNQHLAKAITVWRDPADGKTYVVNGHHRFDLASRHGAEHMKVDMLGHEVEDAKSARILGALENIADNNGTPLDAAKLMRDTGMSLEQMREEYGISPRGPVAEGGGALARLDQSIFDDVVSGKIPERRGIAIGLAADTPTQQHGLLEMIRNAEKRGRTVTNASIEELGRMVRGSGEHTVSQETLFGTQEQTHSLALEKADISAYIRGKIASDRRLFEGLTSQKKADTLATEGNTINTSANKERATAAEQAAEVYDRLSVRAGAVDELLNEAARELANGKGNPTAIRARAYEGIRAALRETIEGAVAGDRGGTQEDAAGSGDTSEEEKRPTRAELESAGQGGIFFQGRKAKPVESHVLPGMDTDVANQRSAAEMERGRALTEQMRASLGSIDGATGYIEQHSPLFALTDANPQGDLFRDEAAQDPELLFQQAKHDIHSVLEAAKRKGHAPEKAVIAPVDSWIVDAAKEQGHDLSGFTHVIDGSAVRHVLNKHGVSSGEAKRGQVPVTEADFEKIPEIVASPDSVIFGSKNNTGRDQVISVKRMADGSTIYVEEIRTRHKELATVSMWKYPATMDVSRLEAAPHHYVRGDSGTDLIVVRNPEADKNYYQGEADQPRGWFRVLPDGTYEIGRTKIGDLSTFVHEPAHAYLHMIQDLASREGASDTIKADYAKILEFLGAKDGDSLTREQHELWARANEQYLREGKAPSAGLKGMFQRFAVWLGTVYKKASDLGVELNDSIRGVFDRMYAAEDGVNRADKETGPQLFQSPEDAGWTEEEFRKYAEDNNVSVEQAKSHLLGLLNEAAMRERSDAWREEQQNVREAMTAEIDKRPEYAAIRALRKGQLDDGTELTLSRDELVKQFGEQRVKELQKQHPGLYHKEGGAEPETAAEILGFDSAESMMRALEASPRRSAAIAQATRDYMTAKHGDIRYDGTLDDQARIALENDKRAEGLHSELKALREKLARMQAESAKKADAMRSIAVAPVSAYREAAHQMVEAKAVADLQPNRYLDASRKYSREAFDALRKGDVQAAADAKHKELMNHFLFREATKAKEYIGKFEAYVKRTQGKGIQSKLGLAGGDYRDQFNRILGRYGMGPNVATERTLAEWSAAQFDERKEPAIDPSILAESRMVNYRNAPVAEIRAVHDALVNIRKLASLELGIEVNGKRIEFNAATENMNAQARQSLKEKPARVLQGNATFGEKVGDLVQRGDAMLMRTERLMEWLDGGKTGPWHDNLWNLAADAQGNEYKLQEEVTRALGDALERMPKEQRARMLDKVTVPGIPETVTRHDLLSMAFNMGNDGNLDRLQKTFVAHGWDHTAIDTIQGMLTREEWQFVQDGWDSLKPLGKAQAELEKRLTGLPPVMVTPTPLQLKLADGSEMELAGGYYPVVMDPRFSARGAQQDAGMTAQNLMESGYGRATTSRGNMKERTGYGGPLQLDYEQVLTQHTAKVIKDITHREFMLAANKLLLDPSVRQTMRETLGEGYEKQMMPWLRTIINDRNGSAVQGLGDFSRLMRTLRTNVTLATLSYKISTSLLQWTHAPRMLLSTNPGSYAQAMVDFLAHPAEMTRQIKGMSPNEMAHRGENLDRDIRATLMGGPGLARTVAQAGNISIKYTDHVLSFPLWLSVYRDTLKQNVDLSEDRAHYLAMHAADSAVRLGLGSGAPKDLPPIMRNNDLSKLLTMFYSFHNGIYGQVRDIGHQFGQDRKVGKLTYGMAMAVLVPAVLGSLVSGHGPKDDENKGAWAAKRALLFGADTMPLLRDGATAIDRDGEVKMTPLMDVLSKGAKATQAALADKDEKDWTGIGLNYLEVGGDLAGVPGTAQGMKPLRYMHHVQQGTVSNPNAWDAVAGSAHH